MGKLDLGRVVVLLAVSAAPLPAQAASASKADRLVATLDRLCQPLVDSGLSHGFCVGVIDGERTLVRGYGVTAPGKAAPRGDTVYEIGSIAKVFTGLLLADAVERGVVTMDDPVQRWLPDDVTMPTWRGEPVRLWQLTTHTSGLPRLPPLPDSDPDDPYATCTVERLYAALGEVEVRREPGSGYEYSNLAVGLLGHVLARAGGAADYATLLRDRIAAPLGLRDTAVGATPAMRARLAPPFDAEGRPAQNWDLAALAGAGGVLSTVDDLLGFARAQLRASAVPLRDAAPGDTAIARAIARSHRVLYLGPDAAVACGWHFAADRATLWHNGQTAGYRAMLMVRPRAAKAVVILDNSSTEQIDAVADRVMKHLLGAAVEPLDIEAPAAVARDVLQRYVGVYAMQPGVAFDVTLSGDALSAQLTGQDAFRIHPRSATEFFYRAVDASITFEVDPATGAVQALVLHQNGRDLRCVRRGGR